MTLLLLFGAALPTMAEGMLLDPGRILLMGEIHGTVESPAFVLQNATDVHDDGKELLVALQLPTEEQERIDSYLDSDGGEAAREALLSGAAWSAPRQDGTTSRAIFDLIDGLRQLRADGPKLTLLAFAEPVGETPDSEPREEAMARRLLEAANGAPEAVMLVLSSNLHSRVRRGRGKLRNFRTMGWYLSQMVRDNRVVGVDAAHHGGEAWFCDPASPDDCAARPVKARGPRDGEWITLYGRIDITKHHGWYYVGELHASPPARLSLGLVDAP